MRITVEALSIGVVVRRIRSGSAPFAWEICRADATGPIHVSSDRFKSMEAAYRAGQARLAEFIPKRSMPPGVTRNRLWQSGQVGSDGGDAHAG
jgi:hypothetical protein